MSPEQEIPTADIRSPFELIASNRSPGVIRQDLLANVGKFLFRRATHLRVIRPDDLLVIDFFFHNLRFDQSGPSFVRTDPAKPSYLIAQFQGQSFGEEAYFDSGNAATSDEPATLPKETARARFSGPSRLVFKMPAAEQAIGYELEELLDACLRWPMQLDGLAAPLPDDFDDDLPSKFRFGNIIVSDAIEVSRRGLRGLLTASELTGMRLRMNEELPPESAPAVGRAAERAARQVTGATLSDLREGRVDTQVVMQRVREQTRAVTAAMGLSEAEEIQAVEAMVQVSLASNLAEMAANAQLEVSVIDLGKVSEIIKLLLVPHRPGPLVTSLELPYRLYESPIEPAGWRHSHEPVTRNNRTELWHTRLAPRVGGVVDEKSGKRPMMRALWSPDYGKTQADDDPFLMAMTPYDRDNIVRATSGYNEEAFVPDVVPPKKEPFIPKPVSVRRLILSALGSWLDSEGYWNRMPVLFDRETAEDKQISLEAWRHLSAMGRDYYVRIIRKGFLFPFRHAAVRVDVTERRFEDIPNGVGRAAYLRKMMFIIVREPVRTYPDTGQPFDGRDFPFHKVEILTKVTPLLLPASTSEGRITELTGAAQAQSFWPMYDPGNGTKIDFRFKVRATDPSGREAGFSMPMIFMQTEVNTASQVANVIKHYQAPKSDIRATAGLAGQSLELAPQVVAGNPDGDVVLPVQSIRFSGAAPTNPLPPNRPQFHPGTLRLTIGVPALQKLAQLDAGVVVQYPDRYKNGGFGGSNPGQVFLTTVAASAPDVAFGGGKAGSDGVGGLVAPNMKLGGLSRTAGAVGGDADKFGGGNFNPADFFPSAKLFGTIDLAKLIGAVASTQLTEVPKLKKVEFPDRVEVSFDFARTQVNSPLPILKTKAGGNDSALKVSARAISYLELGAGGNPGASKPELWIDSSLTNFKLNLFGCITIWFDEIRFKVKAGEKPDVDPKLHPTDPVVFGGPLEFVNTLSEILPSNGFSDPPMLAVSPAGITTGYSLGLPTLTVGIFSIQNMSIGAMLELPFDGDPISVRFNFCERQKPFLLTVSLFGGGGFFAISLDSDGVREIEAAFEFGAFAAVDLGVASGSVYVKAGIYFHWKTDQVELEGYIEMGGELSVLGIISVSLKFHLSLSYHKDSAAHRSELVGQASLVVEIEILFFSASVTVSVERRLAGSNADPLFVDFVPTQQVWDEYALAFA